MHDPILSSHTADAARSWVGRMPPFLTLAFAARPRYAWLTTLFLMTSFIYASAQNLTEAQLSIVSQRLTEGATHSWEYGTRSEAILEYNASSYSVFSSLPVPPPQQVPSGLTSALSDVWAIAHGVVANRSYSTSNGAQSFMSDGSAADPASIGVAVLLANWTGRGSEDGQDYANAARNQLGYLLSSTVPRTQDGAISHRTDQLQLWSDFVYMVPPFLAYYGVTTSNISLLEEAYTQISLYRKYLRDTKAHGLWKHIQLGSYGTDDGHWSTGNAWAAAGMIRVLGTMRRSAYAKALQQQQKDLASWVQEIHSGMYRHQDASGGLFHNYADNASTFLDASSAALVASTVYRLSSLWGVHTHLPQAELTRQRLSAKQDSARQDWVHFTSEGWLTPVVNPYAYGDQGQHSPEGQAFVIVMQAAWREWVAGGAVGANAGSKRVDRSLIMSGCHLFVSLVCSYVGVLG